MRRKNACHVFPLDSRGSAAQTFPAPARSATRRPDGVRLAFSLFEDRCWTSVGSAALETNLAEGVCVLLAGCRRRPNHRLAPENRIKPHQDHQSSTAAAKPP